MAKFYTTYSLEDYLANRINDQYAELGSLRVSDIRELVKDMIEDFEIDNGVMVNIE